MPTIAYEDIKFSHATLDVIARANEIVAQYDQLGLDLTLRQIYYQFVARGWLENTQANTSAGDILNNARLGGLLDWLAIQDRTRGIRKNSHWTNPAEIIESAARSYGEDLWLNQRNYVEVWIEKDALIGILDAVCPENDVCYFSCRGYTSQSEMWIAAKRIERAVHKGKHRRQPIVIHLGDHDPSGIDMTRDTEERLNKFSEEGIYVRRIALTMAQIEDHNPPPNPAKTTDSRAAGYIKNFGHESWELDALEPTLLINLIQNEIDKYRDMKLWDKARTAQEANRKLITAAAGKMPKKKTRRDV